MQTSSRVLFCVVAVRRLLGFEELVREFFTRRVKIGVVQRNRISGLEAILMDYRYANAIGLLLHQEEDLSQEDFIMSKGRSGNGVIE